MHPVIIRVEVRRGFFFLVVVVVVVVGGGLKGQNIISGPTTVLLLSPFEAVLED